MIASLIACIAVVPQAVNLDIRGQRLEAVTAQLATALGAPSLTVSNGLKDDVLVIRTKNVSPDEFRRRLLSALNATLVRKENSWNIEQTPEQVAADKQRHISLRYANFDRLVTQLKERVANQKPFDEAEAKSLRSELEMLSKFPISTENSSIAAFSKRVGAADRRGPISRLSTEILAKMNAQDWMLLIDSRPVVVLSTSPTKLQSPLTFDFRPFIDRAVAAQNIWAEASRGEPLRGPSLPGQNAWYGLGTSNDFRSAVRAEDFGIVTIKLSSDPFQVEVCVYDRVGKRLGSSREGLPGPISTDPNLQEKYNEYLKIKTVLEGPKEEFLVRYNNEIPANHAGPLPPPSQELRTRLLDPITYDPLESHAEVALRCTKQENLIAILDDRLTGSRRFSAEYAAVSRNHDGSVQVEPNWVIYRPVDVVAGRRDRADRAKLRTMGRALDAAQGHLSLEERAAFAYSLPWEASSATYYNQFLRLFNPAQSYGSFADSTLRIYGAMTQAEREALPKGIPLTKLSQTVQLELYRLLLFKGGTGSYTEQCSFQSPEDAKVAENYQMLRSNGILREETFLFGDGFLPSQTLSGGIFNRQVLEMENEAGSPQRISYLPPRMVGDLLFKRTRPEKYKLEIQSYPFREDSIRVTNTTGIDLRIAVNKQTTFMPMSNQASFSDDKRYTLATLPSAIRAEIQEAYNQAERNFKDGN